MKIFYLVNSRLPTEKAHGIQVMEMCSVFSAWGHDVELVVPDRKNTIHVSPFSYYSKAEQFKITKLPDVDLFKYGLIGFILQSLQFAARAAWYVRGQEGIVYARDEYALFFLKLILRRRCFYEAHDLRRNLFARLMLKKIDGVVTITQGLKERLITSGIPQEKILVAADGVDLESYQIIKDKQECRINLRLPLDKKLVVYTGHLYKWKGAEVLAQAALSLSRDVVVVFVGGTVADIDVFNTQYGRVECIIITGHRPHSEIAEYQMAADILVVPNTQKAEISARYTSPMKLFEYMASDRPIVASDLPSLREILNEQNSVLVAPDDPQALAQGIRRLLSDEVLGRQLADRARQNVVRHSWKERAAQILKFIAVDA